ncbi:hypothetical protein [Nannocystis pusilla]|uniref:Uncharacterized protein n=1 Tax=Nannocystis pusilla TaxID=889268 RepID=A0ABS7U0H2_9BACT|nr:hypothetical protein [Nannocystis pusilla]MBZ5713944.1 hypothetical protein [Nannocystis pusilla]
MTAARKPAVLALAVLACNSGGAETSPGFTTQPGTTAPITTLPDDTSEGSSTGSSSTSTSTSGGSSTDSSAGASASTGMVWDMGTPPDFDVTPPGCQGKIDFLFIISRHSFMLSHQEQLVAAFPQFIDTIQSQFTDFDVQILVTDSVQQWGSNACEDDCPEICMAEPAYPCAYAPTTCDETIGAGIVMNVGPNTANAPCLDGPRRYITADTLDIPATFECLARVGTYGNNKIGDALLGAMSPKLNKVGGCNEGFIRDDALLMVTLIGPEDNADTPASSQGTWQEWMQAVVDRKKGDLDAIVMFTLTDDCMGTKNPDNRLCTMTPKFPHSLLEVLTTPDYGPIFDEAAALALEACSAFVPG